jgi:hypothetical protein
LGVQHGKREGGGPPFKKLKSRGARYSYTAAASRSPASKIAPGTIILWSDVSGTRSIGGIWLQDSMLFSARMDA